MKDATALPPGLSLSSPFAAAYIYGPFSEGLPPARKRGASAPAAPAAPRVLLDGQGRANVTLENRAYGKRVTP